MIRHAGILVHDLDKALKFYKTFGFVFECQGYISKKKTRQVFGLDALYDELSGFTWMKVKHPKYDTMIEFYYFDEEPLIMCNAKNHYNHIAITVDNLQAMYSKFKKTRYFDLISVPIENKKTIMLMVRDPFGNLLELVEEKNDTVKKKNADNRDRKQKREVGQDNSKQEVKTKKQRHTKKIRCK